MPGAVELRAFPYPYRASLSICSDIDHTRTAEQFQAVQAFMNQEIGIAFTNTFFPMHEQDELAFFSSRTGDRALLLEHLKNGNIEALHGYGELSSFAREDALKVLEALRRAGVGLKLWIDHAYFPGNLCKYRHAGRGDQPGAREYHLDATLDYGVQYVWTDRLTSVIGQGVPVTVGSLLALLDARHVFASVLNLGKTCLKLLLGLAGSRKYAFLSGNAPVFPTTLGDGRKVFEFIRFNNYYQGAARGDSFTELHYMISKKVLQTLAARRAYATVYVHLGKGFDRSAPGNQTSIEALRHLKKVSDQGTIWVSSTLTQLDYYVRHRYLDWSAACVQDEVRIELRAIQDPVRGTYVPRVADLRGLTFYVPEQARVRAWVGGVEVALVFNAADDSGRVSVSLV